MTSVVNVTFSFVFSQPTFFFGRRMSHDDFENSNQKLFKYILKMPFKFTSFYWHTDYDYSQASVWFGLVMHNDTYQSVVILSQWSELSLFGRKMSFLCKNYNWTVNRINWNSNKTWNRMLPFIHFLLYLHPLQVVWKFREADDTQLRSNEKTTLKMQTAIY